MRFLWFLFGSVSLYATVNEPLSCEWATGYRNDNFHWHLKNAGDDAALTFSEHYRDVQFWQNDLTLRAIHRDLTFWVQGGYGVFGRGSLQTTWDQLSFAREAPQFTSPTQGWAAHAQGYFGFAVNLTSGRFYQVIFTPAIGYEAHFLHLHRDTASPNPLSSTAAIGGSSYTASTHFSHNEHTTWSGWLFAGDISIHPGRQLFFDIGYAYHLLRTRLSTAAAIEANVWAANGSLVSTALQSFSLSYNKGGSFGHSGWMKMAYSLRRYWKIGLGASMYYFYSSVQPSTLDQRVGISPMLEEKIKMRWTSVTRSLFVTRSF